MLTQRETLSCFDEYLRKERLPSLPAVKYMYCIQIYSHNFHSLSMYSFHRLSKTTVLDSQRKDAKKSATFPAKVIPEESDGVCISCHCDMTDSLTFKFVYQKYVYAKPSVSAFSGAFSGCTST